MPNKITGRARLFLEAVPDWSADWEISPRIGDTPPTPRLAVRSMMGRLINRGFVRWHAGNNTYRITDEGRAALLTPPSSTLTDETTAKTSINREAKHG